MITLNAEQHLGRKAFFFLVSKKTTWPFFILLADILIFILRAPIVNIIVATAKLGGKVSSATILTLNSAVNSVILGIFMVGIILLLVSFILSFLEYRNYTFSLGEFDIIMKRGIFDKKETAIPYHQIDSVNIERNIAHQFLGLSKLVMMTAAHEESSEHQMAEVVLEPIEKSFAEEIQQLLERKIGVQIVKNEADADKEVAENTFLRQ